MHLMNFAINRSELVWFKQDLRNLCFFNLVGYAVFCYIFVMGLVNVF